MGRGGLSKNNRLSVLGRLYFLCLFSHSHAAFRVALVLSPTYGTMQLIKIHSLFIRRTDAQNLSPPLLPALESQTPSSAPTRPRVQRTRGQWFSSESSRRSTETLLSHHFCVVTGLLVQLYFIQQPRHSSEDRVNQAATVNSLAMKTRRATTFLLCCFAPPTNPWKGHRPISTAHFNKQVECKCLNLSEEKGEVQQYYTRTAVESQTKWFKESELVVILTQNQMWLLLFSIELHLLNKYNRNLRADPF